MSTDRDRPGGLYLLIGLLGAVLGLLPWLRTGMRLPLQNLWATQVRSEQMPIGLLPFSQYHLSLILAMIIFGGATTGLVVRRLRRGLDDPPGLAATGFALIIVVAGVQTSVMLYRGLADEFRSDLYLGALVAATVVALLVGLAVLVLLAVAPPPGASVGATFGALAAGFWLNAMIFPPGSVGTLLNSRLLAQASWLPGILVGLALAWCGLTSVGRVLAWIVDLLLLWIVPAALTAMSYGVGSRVLLIGDPAEALAASLQVFEMALRTPEVSLRLVVLAVTIGVIGSLLRRLRRRGV